jgi:hypothetical protein
MARDNKIPGIWTVFRFDRIRVLRLVGPRHFRPKPFSLGKRLDHGKLGLGHWAGHDVINVGIM